MNELLSRQDFDQARMGYHIEPERSCSLNSRVYTEQRWSEIDRRAPDHLPFLAMGLPP